MSELFSVPGLSLQDEDRQRPAEFDAQIAAGANLAAMLDAEQQRNNAVLVAQPPELHVSALDFNCLHPELAYEVVLPISIPRLRTDDKGALYQVHTVRPVVISNEKVQAILNTSGIDGNSPGVAQLPEVLPNREFPVHVAPPDRVVLDIPVTEITVFAKPLAIAGQPGGPGFGTTRLIIKNAAGAPVLDKNIPVRSARSAENYYCYIAPRPSKHLLPKRAQKRDDPSAAASPPNKRQRASLSCEEQHSPLPGVPAAAAQPPVHDEQQLFLDEVFATANDTVEEHYPKG